MSSPALSGWLPFRLFWSATGPMLDWFHLGAGRLVEPFFEDTVAAVMKKPFNLLFRQQTPLDTLQDWEARSPGLPPKGFIFHLSRCGSTLACQMLAALPQNVVVSEAPPIDGILRTAKLKGISEEQRVQWLRAIVSALGQPRAGSETQMFVKFDNWHLLDLPLIRKAFPEVPWIFLFRDPVEILVSITTNPAPHAVPGMMKLGVPELDAARPGLVKIADHSARVLRLLCEQALAHLQRDERGLAVHYEELPEAMHTRIASHFGLSFSAEEADLMLAKSRYNAKSPLMEFEADSQSKQDKATPEIRAAVERELAPLYRELCTLSGKP